MLHHSAIIIIIIRCNASVGLKIKEGGGGAKRGFSVESVLAHHCYQCDPVER